MGCLSIPFRRLPHQPKLFVQLIDNFPGVANFYAHPPTLDSVKRVALDLQFPTELRRPVAAALRDCNRLLGGSEQTQRNLDALENGAVAVVSGQQVGLFGGPAYAFYKALSAIRIAEELNAEGIQAVPVFWMATEDHDLDEVRHVSWVDRGKLTRFELPADGPGARPVGQVPLGPRVEEFTKWASELCSGPGSQLITEIIRESYRSEETYGSAFGKLFARVFAEFGLILLDPLDARLHRIAAPVYRKVLEDRDQLTKDLLQRAKELEATGFDPQVRVTTSNTLLFRMKDGVREPIVASDGAATGGVRFKSGVSSWTRDEMLRLVEAEPE